MAIGIGPLRLGGRGQDDQPARGLQVSPEDDAVRDNSVEPAGGRVDLSGRDPEFIRAMLPRMWLLTAVYHRAEVNGFEKVPDEPVLFVGNHSGGAMVPDTFVFLLAYNTYFTVDGRPLYSLGHDMVTKVPLVGTLARKMGIVTAGPGPRRRSSAPTPPAWSTRAATSRRCARGATATRSSSTAGRASCGWPTRPGSRSCRSSPPAGRTRSSSTTTAASGPSGCASTSTCGSRPCP